MRNDVKTLITALTTERDAIDRAIAGLRQMSEGLVEQAATARRPVKAHGGKRTRISDETKLAIASEMLAARRGELANIARRHGVSRMTVYQNWRKWAAASGNGSATPVQELVGQ